MKTIDLSVIDQMYSAVLSQNENEATIKALRPRVGEAVCELIRQRGLPRNSPKHTPTPSPSNMASP